MSDEIRVTDREWYLAAAALIALTLTVALLVISAVVAFRSFNAVSAQARESVVDHEALCTFREQLVHQLKDSEHYLAKHPDGAPALHLSAASIQQSINREQAAVTSLTTLNCSE